MSETIQRTKLYEDVTERMLDHIRTETWAPGTKIPPEVELAKLFDVSRCTIREAVKSLQIAGFLRSRAGSGTFVSERAPTLLQTQALAGIMADPAALRELVQARYILEPQLAQMAAQAATEEEIRGLFAILDRMKRGQTRFELMSVTVGALTLSHVAAFEAEKQQAGVSDHRPSPQLLPDYARKIHPVK